MFKCLIFCSISTQVSCMTNDFYNGCTCATVPSNARRLITWCSVTAHTKAASIKPFHHCSLPGALQAKLLVQSEKRQHNYLTPSPSAISYTPQIPPQLLQCESEFELSREKLTVELIDSEETVMRLFRRLTLTDLGLQKRQCLFLKGNSSSN